MAWLAGRRFGSRKVSSASNLMARRWNTFAPATTTLGDSASRKTISSSAQPRTTTRACSCPSRTATTKPSTAGRRRAWKPLPTTSASIRSPTRCVRWTRMDASLRARAARFTPRAVFQKLIGIGFNSSPSRPVIYSDNFFLMRAEQNSQRTTPAASPPVMTNGLPPSAPKSARTARCG